jgi:hypothetical protein
MGQRHLDAEEVNQSLKSNITQWTKSNNRH